MEEVVKQATKTFIKMFEEESGDLVNCYAMSRGLNPTTLKDDILNGRNVPADHIVKYMESVLTHPGNLKLQNKDIEQVISSYKIYKDWEATPEGQRYGLSLAAGLP